MTKRMVLAFDVDGTLWLGSPSGPVTKEMAESCREYAYMGIVSSRGDASDIAKQLGWDFGFTGATDAMLRVKNELYPNGGRYIHVADMYFDELEAKGADFEFIYASNFKGCYTSEQLAQRYATVGISILSGIAFFLWVVRLMAR